MMTEHRHEYIVEVDTKEYDIVYAYCSVTGCTKVIYPEEIERRLNATEALSAEDAKSLAFLIREPNIDTSPLEDYAAILEGQECSTCPADDSYWCDPCSMEEGQDETE
jgi:hypothetical protein